MSPNRPNMRIQIPRTPPPVFSAQIVSSPGSYTPPRQSCYSHETPRSREIIMGGLVSRQNSPRIPTSPERDMEEAWEVKRVDSIEVPGIILTEPMPDLPPRSPSPPPKQIMLLPPASLPLPLHNNTSLPRHTFSPAFSAFLYGSPKRPNKYLAAMRSLLAIFAFLLVVWHLYRVIDMGNFIDDGLVEGF